MKVVLLNDTSVESHYGCAKVKLAVTSLFDYLTWSVVQCIPVGTSFKDIESKLSSLAYDVVVINGEGTMHDKNVYASTLMKCCVKEKEKEKLVCIINASIYFQNIDMLEVLRNSVDFISVRSSKVSLYLKKHNIDSLYIPDLSFLFSKSNVEENVGYKRMVTYTDSVKITTSFSLLLKSLNGLARYIPFVYPPNNMTFPFLRYLKRAFLNCNNIFDYLVFLVVAISGYYRGCSEDKSFNIDHLLSSSSKVVTGRFHAVCFCIRLGVPFDCVVSNTDKINDLLFDVGIDSLFLSKKNGNKALPEKNYVEYKSRVKKFSSHFEEFENDLLENLREMTRHA